MTQYYIANLDSTSQQLSASVSFLSYKSINGDYTRYGTFGLYDLIDITVPESGYYTIKAKQGWTPRSYLVSSLPNLSSIETRSNDGVTEYYLKLDDNNAFSRSAYGRETPFSQERRHMLPAIALYTNSDHLTGLYMSTQNSGDFKYNKSRYAPDTPAGDEKCIGQGLPLMEEAKRTVPRNYYLENNYQTLSSIEVKINDYSNGEGRDFVYLDSNNTYTLLATQIPLNGPFERDIASTAPTDVLSSYISNGHYEITVDKLPHVTNPNLSGSQGGGLYFSEGTGRSAITDLNYFISPDETITDENGLFLRVPTYLTNADNYTSASEMFEVYFNKWSVEYDRDESNRYGIPLQFNLIAGRLNFGKWLAWVGQGNPATTECDFVITRKSDRSAIRVQGELSHANYKSLSCTDVTNRVNTPSLQRLRNLGYV